MSLFNTIGNFISNVLGLEETKTEVKTRNKNNQNIEVFENNNQEKLEDSFQFNDYKTADKNSGKMTEKSFEQVILNTPVKNIDLQSIVRNKIYKTIAGDFGEKFDQLSEHDKTILVHVFQHMLVKVDELKTNNLLSKDVSPEHIIAELSKILYEGLKNKEFTSIQDFEEALGDINKDLGKDFDKLSNEDQITKIKATRIEYDKKVSKEVADIDKTLSKENQQKAETRIRNRHSRIKRGKYAQILARKSSRAAANSMLILDSKDISYGANSLLSTRINDKERMETADYVDYNFTQNLIKNYQEINDKVPVNVLKDYTQIFVSNKSAEAATKYQAAYNEDRQKYEKALLKSRNGEPLNEEEKNLIKTMSKEYYTAQAEGIGSGILLNSFITKDEKIELIEKWHTDAKNYSDFKTVVKTINETISKNTDLKNLDETIDNKKQDIETANQNPTSTNSYKVEMPLNQRYTTRTLSQSNNNISKENPKNNLSKIKETKSKNIINNVNSANIKNNPQLIKKEIDINGISEILTKYGSDVIAPILNDPSLKYLRKNIINKIKSYDFNTLEKITNDCTDSAFVYICNSINKEKAQKLIFIRENGKGLCYAGKKQLEDIKGQNNHD